MTMTTDTDLFAGDTPQDTPPSTNEVDLFEGMVGEGKKFKTPQDLAKAAIEKDNFIEQLKRENAEMRREMASLAKSSAVDDALARLNDKLEKASGTDGTSATGAKGLTRDDIRAILLEEKQQTEQAANIASVQAELLGKFDNDAELVKKHLASKAAELGVTTKDLRDMVARTPEVARVVLGLKNPVQSGPTTVPRTSKNAEALDVSTEGTRNKAYYDDLKKKLGHRFWTPKIQQQMFRDAKALGEKFYQ